MSAGKPDWTMDEFGRSNASARFHNICAEVERLIRSDAHSLLAGRADSTARLIVAKLTHEYGFAPRRSKAEVQLR